MRPVLDGQAKRVGTAFARLLTRGFAIERALRIASRRTIMNKDYAVVGDGTQLGRGAVVVDGEAQASPTFPVEFCSETTPGGLILAGERPGLPLGPIRERVGFR